MQTQQNGTCPRCHVPLQARQACVQLAACLSCGGMWLNEADAHRLQYNFSQAGHQLADSIGNEAPHVVCTRATDIPCPVCRKPMQRAKAGNTWVELDWCNGHGSWFDRGELQRIAHAYHGCLPSTSHETSSDTATDTAMAVGAELAIGIVFGLLEAALDS